MQSHTQIFILNNFLSQKNVSASIILLHAPIFLIDTKQDMIKKKRSIYLLLGNQCHLVTWIRNNNIICFTQQVSDVIVFSSVTDLSQKVKEPIKDLEPRKRAEIQIKNKPHGFQRFYNFNQRCTLKWKNTIHIHILYVPF